MTKTNALSPNEVVRYARQLILPEMGPEGQARLGDGRVLLVGAGGLGSPAALYLAAAGVGTLGLVDGDRVEESNLHRQILHATPDVGRPKTASAEERLHGLNPLVRVRTHPVRLTSGNALDIVREYDVVVDGSDNFPTRYLVNDACVLTGRPYVYGSVHRFDGQVSVFASPGGPCFRCLFAEPPPPGLVPSCAEAGVVGAVPGVIGSLQALEAIKLLLGTDGTLAGRLLLFDGLRMRFRELHIARDGACPVCGDDPTVRELIDYDRFCGLGPRPPAKVMEGDVPEISVRELKDRIDAGEAPLIVDVREPHEWQIVNLEAAGARLIPLGELAERFGEIDPAAEVVVHCRSGSRSERAVRFLRDRGYDRACNLRGGVLAWSDEIDPEMPKY